MGKITVGTAQYKSVETESPGVYLDINEPERLGEYLKEKGFVESDRKLHSLEKPGEGNMNLVLRAKFENGDSIIVKQARPWVEKYPDIEAPVTRSAVESMFLDIMLDHPELSSNSPTILGYDEENAVIILEDLGEAADFSFVYEKDNQFNKEQIKEIVGFANTLNALDRNSFPENKEMRKLNHAHIFHLPFISDNGFPLDEIQPGLKELSCIVTADKELFEKVRHLGEIYLSKGDFLQHGDLYPGSILNTETGIRIIDPEFSFVGPQEWDLSIFVAHQFLAGSGKAGIKHTINCFEKYEGFSDQRFAGFVGTEIIRRLAGIAQLPLKMNLEEKELLLRNAVGLIKKGIIEV